jgi:hypothetical protein
MLGHFRTDAIAWDYPKLYLSRHLLTPKTSQCLNFTGFEDGPSWLEAKANLLSGHDLLDSCNS